jgi:hypothetical protein
MDYLALLQTILAALSETPDAIQIAEGAYNGVRASFNAEDQATLDKMFADAKSTDAADTAKAVADLNEAAKEN